jgi:hypothetical protein
MRLQKPRITGKVVGLDIATRTGFAIGAPGYKPHSGSVVLRDERHGERMDQAWLNMFRFLEAEHHRGPIALIAKEKMLHIFVLAKLKNRAENTELQMKIHGVVELFCRLFEIPWTEIAVASARKHFIGIPGTGDRTETKQLVLDRCKLLGLVERDCDNFDRSDALAVHDWACANYGRRSISTEKLFLFGEGTTNEQASR